MGTQVLIPGMGGAVLVLFLGVLSIGSAKHVGRMRQAPDGHSCGDGHSHGGCANVEDAMMNLEAAPVQMEQKNKESCFHSKGFSKETWKQCSTFQEVASKHCQYC